jgi:hypothetical protein
MENLQFSQFIILFAMATREPVYVPIYRQIVLQSDTTRSVAPEKKQFNIFRTKSIPKFPTSMKPHIMRHINIQTRNHRYEQHVSHFPLWQIKTRLVLRCNRAKIPNQRLE